MNRYSFWFKETRDHSLYLVLLLDYAGNQKRVEVVFKHMDNNGFNRSCKQIKIRDYNKSLESLRVNRYNGSCSYKSLLGVNGDKWKEVMDYLLDEYGKRYSIMPGTMMERFRVMDIEGLFERVKDKEQEFPRIVRCIVDEVTGFEKGVEYPVMYAKLHTDGNLLISIEDRMGSIINFDDTQFINRFDI